jgi:hypothetical protein
MFRLKAHKRVLVLIVLALGFSSGVVAQEDCYYGYKIYVRDEAGKAIRNGKLEVSGLKSPLLGDATYYVDQNDVYHIMGATGSTLRGDFIFRISADGFAPFERRFNFPDCEIQFFELRLQPKDSSAKALYERLFILYGKVYDEDKKPLASVRIEATSADGRVYQTVSNPYGYYEIALPRGVANIRVSDGRVPDMVFKNYRIEKNRSVLNVRVCLRCDRL